jgi:D-alanyl-D-alanine carboxypeptidase
VIVAEAFLLAGAASFVVGPAVGGDAAPASPERSGTATGLATPRQPRDGAAPTGSESAPPTGPAEPPQAQAPRSSGRSRPVVDVPAAPVGTLPAGPLAGGNGACPFGDKQTAHQAYDEWALTLLDTEHRLSAGYAPRDLVDTSAAGLNRGQKVRHLVLDDLAAMATAARHAGVPFVVVSGYRSYATQVSTFQHWVKHDGLAYALRTSARPGHSEHQLGTAIDVTGRGQRDPWTYADWGKSPAGAWIGANAWRYGFVVSYPRGASARTCYDYEPWHLRYFGRERAAAIEASGLTARQYLLARQ